jgi:uncharacterized protein (TIGR02246 family)
MGLVVPADEVRSALAEFDRRFAAGDADALAEMFAADAQLLLQHSEPIEGRPAIRESWARLFAAYDPAAWRAEHRIVQVHGDNAYTHSVYAETLVHRGGGPSRVVRGRLVFFLRRAPGGTWRVALAMNSHARPVEEVDEEGRR